MIRLILSAGLALAVSTTASAQLPTDLGQYKDESAEAVFTAAVRGYLTAEMAPRDSTPLLARGRGVVGVVPVEGTRDG